MKNIKKTIIMLITIQLVSGCSNTMKLDQLKLESSEPRSLIVSKREKPGFFVRSVGKAVAGAILFPIGTLVSLFSMESKGNEVVKNNDIVDPSSYINIEIANILLKKYNIEETHFHTEKTHSMSDDTLSTEYAIGDLLIDTQTIMWDVKPFFTAPDSYVVRYFAFLKLIDTRKKEVIAKLFCIIDPDYEENLPSYEQLLANQAEIIKNQLKINADECVKKFKEDILNI